MRLFNFKKTIKLWLLLAVVVACSKNQEVILQENRPTEQENSKTLTQLPPEIVAYYSNIKTIMYATRAFNEPELSQTAALLNEMEQAPKVRKDEILQESNPMQMKLQNLDLVDEVTKEKLDFFKMQDEEKVAFLDMFLVEEAKMMAEKLEIAPSLKEIIEKENEIFSQEIQNHQIEGLQLGQETPIDSYIAENKMVAAGEIFPELHKKMEETAELTNASGLITPIGATFGYPKVHIDVVKKKWEQHARRGDFILALPLHNQPYRLVNFGSRFVVGHAGILSERVNNKTKNDEKVSIEAYSRGGVERLTLNNWEAPHYIMGIQKIKWRWRWRGFKSGLYKTCTPVSNPDALANWANKYVGREYVKWYEFLTAKWAAPKRFTCTTLVWWCAKQAYGINVSSWYSPLVTPSGLFTDSCTYIRAEVR